MLVMTLAQTGEWLIADCISVGLAVDEKAIVLNLIPFLLGAVLLESGLIVFFNDLTLISNGNPPGGSIYAPALGVVFLLGMLFLLYGSFEGKNPSL
jgi:hypothetical protein